jgi:hypothetical protein
VPAPPSSPISPALEQLQDLPAGDRALLASKCPGLAEHLAQVPDPRDPRGVRHTLTSLLLGAIAAMLAGAQSLAAVGEWVADAPPQVLAALGIRRDPLTGDSGMAGISGGRWPLTARRSGEPDRRAATGRP